MKAARGTSGSAADAVESVRQESAIHVDLQGRVAAERQGSPREALGVETAEVLVDEEDAHADALRGRGPERSIACAPDGEVRAPGCAPVSRYTLER